MRSIGKSLLFFVFILVGLFSFSSCSGNGRKLQNGVNNDRIKIVVSVFPLYDITKQIVKDRADVSFLLPPGVDVHDFEFSAKDVSNIMNADLFLYAGDKCEPWVDQLFKNELEGRSNIIDVTTGLDFIQIGNKVDPHIWLDLQKVRQLMCSILETLCNKDPKNSDFYITNEKCYSDKLESLDEEFRNVADSSRLKKLVFTSRFSANYFVNRYHLQYISAYTSCDDNAEPDAKKISEIINFIKSNKVGSIFYEDGSNLKLANLISGETGAKVLKFNSLHTVDKSGFEDGITYFDLMKENLENLKQGLA